MLPVAILAGGLATRLRPVTETLPKALIEIAGRPFVYRQLEFLQAQGVRDVVLCVGYLGEQIQAAVERIDWHLSVRFSYDGERLLGTGGALLRAAPLLGDRYFVLYGDSYLPCDFATVEAAFLRSGQPALMTVLQNDNRWDTSNVLFRDGRIVAYNKRAPAADMRHIDYGLGVLSAHVFADAAAGQPLDLADLYTALAERGRLAGFEVTERFYEIGSQRGIEETEAYFRRRDGA